jgi:hypothetical protein
VAVLRDPLIPLDFGGWVGRVWYVVRDNAAMLTGFAGVLALLGVVFNLGVELSAPTLDEIGPRLLQAGRATPDGMIDRWTVFRIAYLPAVPAFVVLGALLAVAHAWCCGAAYYRIVRRANGQPTTVLYALRAATPRVLPFLGWNALAVWGTGAILGLLVLPAALTHNPWAEIIGPGIGIVMLSVAMVVVFPTILGVVFLERRGLRRCGRLIKGRFLMAAGRAVAIGVVVGTYLAATAGLMRLLPPPYGGAATVAMPYTAIEYLLSGLLNLPLFGLIIAATLVTYAELRNREDPAATTGSLAADVPA